MSRGEENARACNTEVGDLAEHAATIRRLNDQFRTTLTGGRVLITPGISALAPDHGIMVLRCVCQFVDFDPNSDPYGEQDFGAVEVAGIKAFWKIDYYDKALEFGSPDPADPDVTTRVLTVMLAEEY